MFFIFKTLYNNNMISGTLVKILSILILLVVAIVLIIALELLSREVLPVKNIQIN